jgi:hypothetical protein
MAEDARTQAVSPVSIFGGTDIGTASCAHAPAAHAMIPPNIPAMDSSRLPYRIMTVMMSSCQLS